MHLLVKPRNKMTFSRLITGRCFRSAVLRNYTVWIKINKNVAQDITDENMRRTFEPSDDVTEVSLIPSEDKE